MCKCSQMRSFSHSSREAVCSCTRLSGKESSPVSHPYWPRRAMNRKKILVIIGHRVFNMMSLSELLMLCSASITADYTLC